ncbi:hypothetical protein QFZ27_000246 [Inquilinus ginsengisoli]|uniref:hypothetical protein n=1 Tax=Inquilinus ginsengisoli TaxID=363840 RepID=UPI003D257B26
MTPARVYLDEHDRAAFRAAIAFLNKRLTEPATIDWALRLKPTQRIERLAIEDLLNSLDESVLEEPWATAWRLIEESWSAPPSEEGPSTAIYGIRKRLKKGDRSGAIISKIVDAVAPYLKVTPINPGHWRLVKRPRRAKTFEDLLSARLASGDLVDPEVLGLTELVDLAFLKALGSALESVIGHGLEIARRLGWDGERRLWRLGELRRVYYVTTPANEEGGKDPDAYHHGIAPSVKLLYAVVARIAELSVRDALPFVQRWRVTQSPLHTRLWSAAARNSELVGSQEVYEFLSGLDNRRFWDLHVFPEIAELRALRFNDLGIEPQKAVAKRICKGPPRNLRGKQIEAKEFNSVRLYWAVRELKRIESAGGVLSPTECAWIDAHIGQFPDLDSVNIDEGFRTGVEVRAVPSNPDAKYDAIVGVTRLRALEAAFATDRLSWDDDPAERANDWLRQPGRAMLILNDLEATGNGGHEFPRVWDRFGWVHSSRDRDAPHAALRDLQAEANRVLALLNQLSEGTLSHAVDGISAWLDSWDQQVVASELGLPVWLRIWPLAVNATNAKPEDTEATDLSAVVGSVDDQHEPMDLDALNTPAGRLVGVFLAACPSLADMPSPFETNSSVRQLRDAAIGASGRSGLIVRYRLIEALPYFLRADRSWTEQHLIGPLQNDNEASRTLWRAIARRTHFTEVLKIIGGAMAERATDRRLGRETQRRLVFSLVIESLHAFRENREPAVPYQRIQQMLRSLDDEVRASAANAIQQFVRDLSKDNSSAIEVPSAADLFRSAATPFLERVWPQERSLATPGVSGAFADLPATSGEAFVEAVNAIQRFLVPFECWSMLDYGLYGEESGEGKLAMINGEEKARALLRLLDLTIGNSEGAVIPYDLTEALEQVRSVAPTLTSDPIYRRLSTATRR